MIEDFFDKLDYWRHFPNYQLERRVDIFFVMFINKIIETKTNNNNLSNTIIPEFPILKKLLNDLLKDEKPTETNHSIKVDYFLSDENKKNIYFVELKTDIKSKKNKQGKILEILKDLDFKENVKKIIEIAMNSTRKDYKIKYLFIIKSLGELNYLNDYVELIEKILSKKKSFKIEDYINVPEKESLSIETLYIQPSNPDKLKHIIDFDYVNQIIMDSSNNIFADIFAKYLEKWKNQPIDDYEKYLNIT